MITQPISKGQLDILRKLGLPEVKEKNQWLVLHVKGDGIRAPESWNARVYTNDAGNMKVVTTDMATLVALLSGQTQAPRRVSSEPGRVISIDDSGWGFPIGGTLVGLHDSLTGRIVFDDVPVKYYQSPLFEKKTYLHVAAASALALAMKEFRLYEYNMDDILFKVCTGYVNKGIVDSLKESGFKVETCAIGEPLQSALEKAHAEYIKKLVGSASLYYDPKELTDDNIRKAYSNTMKWIQENNAWGIAKTGWKSMRKLQPEV